MHHGAQDVFAADHAAVKQRQARHHEQDQARGHEHPGHVAVGRGVVAGFFDEFFRDRLIARWVGRYRQNGHRQSKNCDGRDAETLHVSNLRLTPPNIGERLMLRECLIKQHSSANAVPFSIACYKTK